MDNAGAHMLLNGATFNVMLRPPFTNAEYSNRFLNCDAIMYSPEQYINGSQFRHMLSEQNVTGPLVWSSETHSFNFVKYRVEREATAKPLPLALSSPSAKSADQIWWQPNTAGHAEAEGRGVQGEKAEVAFKSIMPGDGLLFRLKGINPLDFQYLQFDIWKKRQGLNQAEVSWSGENAAAANNKKASSGTQEDIRPDIEAAPYFINSSSGSSGEFQTVTVNVGHYWRWYADGDIETLHIALPASPLAVVRNVRLLPYSLCAPSIGVTIGNGSSQSSDPYFAVVGSSKTPISIGPCSIASARALVIEIAKPNFFFENFENDNQVNPIARTIAVPISAKQFLLDAKMGTSNFPIAGFYQLRARYLDGHGQAVGQPSDSITLYVQ